MEEHHVFVISTTRTSKMIRSFVGRVQRRIRRVSFSNEKNNNNSNVVAEDVREGYFVVHAVKGGETKRFIVELEYLNDPEFMLLLDQAQEEFGYRQKGALLVPCKPNELQKVLEGTGGRRRRWSIS